MATVYTFLTNTLTHDIAEQICMEVTRFNFKHVLQAIPDASNVMLNIKNDDRYEPILDRLIELTENLTDLIVTIDTLYVTIMDILENEFGNINKFSDFIHDQIVYWHGLLVSEQEYYIENPPDPLSDDDD